MYRHSLLKDTRLHYYFGRNYEVVKEPDLMVQFMEMTGIEPVTCGLQSHRSPN